MVHGEEDFTKRSSAVIDHQKIKGLTLKDPTIALTVPISIENPAIAYNLASDRFKVDVEAFTTAIVNMNLTQVLDAALSHDNPVISRLTDGSDFIDPRDVSDRAERLLGIVYGTLGQLVQRASTLDLLVQLRHNGAEIDPRSIRALTDADIITVVQSDETDLLATVTQAAKDRTISSIDAVATAVQISNTFAGAGNYIVHTPAEGKKVRLKFISLELSDDADLGYRFAAAGTIFYLRTTAGPYVSNLVGCNTEGAADEALILNASGACTVKGYVILEEI